MKIISIQVHFESICIFQNTADRAKVYSLDPNYFCSFWGSHRNPTFSLKWIFNKLYWLKSTFIKLITFNLKGLNGPQCRVNCKFPSCFYYFPSIGEGGKLLSPIYKFCKSVCLNIKFHICCVGNYLLELEDIH